VQINYGQKLWQIFCGLSAGGALFVFALNFLHLPFYIAVAAGAAGASAGFFLFRSEGRRKFQVKKRPKVRKEDLAQLLNKSFEELDRIKELTAVIENKKFHSKVERICAAIEKMLEGIRQDPGDIHYVKRFLDYIFETSIQIISQYRVISNGKKNTQEVRDLIHRAEEMMGEISTSVEKQHQKLVENNINDLDTELKVLEKVLKMDGFI